VLEGKGNTAPVRVVVEPGTVWRYSGGGYTVAQLVVEDVTGSGFAEFAAETVLGPLGMDHSTFRQPLPEELQNHAATGYLADGTAVEGRFHTYPELAAAGLWATPSDLARYLLAAQEGWRTGEHPVLSPETIREMLIPGMGDVGLGSALTEDGERLFFAGGNDGFRCQMTGFLRGDQGAVVMTNSDTGLQLATEIMLTIAMEYCWLDPKPEYRKVAELPEEDWAALEGTYRGAGREVTVHAGDRRLVVTVVAKGADAPIVLGWLPESRTTYFGTRYGNRIAVHWNDDGTVRGLELADHVFEKVQ
jgi:CubicO group peptidase (beta-lactamase class C family)